ncbi:hypothetical protein ANK1_2814 [plant metagenome]|uniref:Uncharacterized protein n=1 Tax=plant metagenome TaxID=1297885 RepID=A0A484S730_9ZZZZ
MKAPAVTPTLAQLAQAHTAAGLSVPLDVAMRSPLLARCLALTAEALASHVPTRIDAPALATGSRAINRINPDQPGSPMQPASQRRDVKRASAGDIEDLDD